MTVKERALALFCSRGAHNAEGIREDADARKPWTYFTFNPWLKRLPDYLVSGVPLAEKVGRARRFDGAVQRGRMRGAGPAGRRARIRRAVERHARGALEHVAHRQRRRPRHADAR